MPVQNEGFENLVTRPMLQTIRNEDVHEVPLEAPIPIREAIEMWSRALRPSFDPFAVPEGTNPYVTYRYSDNSIDFGEAVSSIISDPSYKPFQPKNAKKDLTF
jgi:hypothetical protein